MTANPPKNNTPDKALVERLRAEGCKNGGQGAYAWQARELCAEAADAIERLSQPQHGGLVEALKRVREWAASLTVTDMNEIVADGGITAGMVVTQEANEQVRRIDAALSNSPVVGEE